MWRNQSGRHFIWQFDYQCEPRLKRNDSKLRECNDHMVTLAALASDAGSTRASVWTHSRNRQLPVLLPREISVRCDIPLICEWPLFLTKGAHIDCRICRTDPLDSLLQWEHARNKSQLCDSLWNVAIQLFYNSKITACLASIPVTKLSTVSFATEMTSENDGLWDFSWSLITG